MICHSSLPVVVIGGGAAGFFGAIAAAECAPTSPVILLEQNRQVLAKVRVSGGGRCNVTHACFDPTLLSRNYPRGGKALVGPFHRFQASDTIAWFNQRGVQLKTESDGRVFPITDTSQTIIDCLEQSAQRNGVTVLTERGVESIEKLPGAPFKLTLKNGQMIEARSLLLATGSQRSAYRWLEQLGHRILPPVPSLFTFHIEDPRLHQLEGVTIEQCHLSLVDMSHQQLGSVLVTHWGLSGPAVLKLSAWAARELYASNYCARLQLNWLGLIKEDEARVLLWQCKTAYPQRHIAKDPQFQLPKSLWLNLVEASGIRSAQRWIDLSKGGLQQLLDQLLRSYFHINGKSIHKQEFVTAGGVCLDQINFKTMESRICPGLYFAGEVLNIDGVTGGFNFQNAWTTGWIAGNALAAVGIQDV